MKPQLVALETSGHHNTDVEASRTRILQGGSWRKQRTVLLIPAGDTIPTKVYLSHCGLVFPPNQPAYRMAAIGQEVGEAYSNSIAEIIAHPEFSKWEYLLTIEHDNIPPVDGLVKLIAHMEAHPEFACIGGLYFCKGPGGCAQLWGDPSDPVPNYRPQVPRADGGLQEVVGTGMGFNLWRLSLFKDERLRRPWFKTTADATGIGTQDLYFWGDARKYGYRCAVAGDVKVGHYDLEGKFGPADFTW